MPHLKGASMAETTGNSALRDVPFASIAEAYLEALLASDRVHAHEIITEAVAEGLAIRDLYLGVFQPVLHEVGHLWLLNQVSIAEEHFCTAATQSIMAELYPHIISSTRLGKTLLATCVGSELHEIGVRMVADFFEMEGWDTYYMGAGVRPDQVMHTIRQRKPDLIALSITMTHHIPIIQELISAIRSAFPDNPHRIMVGGLPFNRSPDLWRTVGADCWAVDALQAVSIAGKLI